ncbi:uncharacterized protein LOC113320498 [Papaver somniferum]|uniref:uncharacterized protein LOC113320498 n=1 Tax=Papaver somniferum TaxID=3469 RepID=UPI000E6FD905|nr:uncharacterized protein LOC113320498 [Papaver somniferum]
MRVDLGIFRASAMDLMLVRCRNGISIILLKSTFLGLGPTLVGFREDTSKGKQGLESVSSSSLLFILNFISSSSLLFILNSISSISSLFIMYSSSSSSLFVMNSIPSISSLFIMYSSSSSLFVMNSISSSSSIITITLINSKGSQKRCKGPSYNEFFITVCNPTCAVFYICYYASQLKMISK